MLSLTKEEYALCKSLTTPIKVQDFLTTIPMNHEIDGVDTVKGPIRVLRERSAHCIEAALLGAYILSLHGHEPLVLHLETGGGDFDHVIAPFQINGLWGALSKTNHAVLRYRDPVYSSIRELVMSYFHEYTNEAGAKTLRRYSALLNLHDFGPQWMGEEEDLWGIDEELGVIPHYDIVPKRTTLRKSDPIEREVGEVLEWHPPRTRTATSSKKYKSVV